MWLIGQRKPANLGNRDGFLIVVLFWMITASLKTPKTWYQVTSPRSKPVRAA